VEEELDLKKKTLICRRGVKNKLARFPYLYLSKSDMLIFLLFRVLDITWLVRLDKVKELYMLILLSFYELMYFIKFYSHQLIHFLIQLCISLLSYIKIT
jgi:hypothetical protein